MSRLQGFTEQMRNTVGGLSGFQKATLAVVLAITVGGLIWVLVAASEGEQRILFSNLPMEQVAQITESLDAKGIPYKVSGESTIHVPADRLHEARIHLASQGLPANDGTGFELFDENGFGMTSFTQRVNYQRALESELARTIRSVAVVRDARVHLVLPEDALFREDQKQPSASVILTMSAGRGLDEGHIQSIRYLVSSAVPGLESRQVNIVDNHGKMLARAVESGSSYEDDPMRLSGKLEDELEERIVELLEPLVGYGQVRASVRVEFDSSRSVETIENYDPNKTAVRSEQRNEETQAQTEPGAAGQPGAAANLPGGPAAEQTQAGQRSSRSSETINYEVNTRIEQKTQIGFRINRITAAVVVGNESIELDENDQPLEDPNERIARLTGLVQNIVGYDDRRGDQVLVSLENFRGPQAPPPEEEASTWEQVASYTPLIEKAVWALVVLLFAFLVLRPVMKMVSPPTPKDAKKKKKKNKKNKKKNADGTDAEQHDDAKATDGLITLQTQPGATAHITARSTDADDRDDDDDDTELSLVDQLRRQTRELGSQDIERTRRVISQWIRLDS